MKKILLISCCIVIETGIIGCSPKVQTVDYYMQHESDIQTILNQCYNMSQDEIQKNANCTNAQKAKIRLQAQKDLDAINSKTKELQQQFDSMQSK